MHIQAVPTVMVAATILAFAAPSAVTSAAVHAVGEVMASASASAPQPPAAAQLAFIRNIAVNQMWGRGVLSVDPGQTDLGRLTSFAIGRTLGIVQPAGDNR